MIRLENIAWRAGAFRLEGITLEVPTGSYGVLMGATGGGKTTLLEIICGLRRLHVGRVLLGGRDVTDLPPRERGLGYVPQDGALFPAMSVREQLGFALSIRGGSAEEIATRTAELAQQLAIAPLLDRFPQNLSGGERQRVALGRALALKPAYLLLDEPLSALDEDLRDELAAVLKQLQQAHGLTVLHVTHSRREAEQVGDVCHVLGRQGHGS